MAVKTHGVLGGPRRKKPIHPRMKQGFFPKDTTLSVVVAPSKTNKQNIEAFVVSFESDDKTLPPVKRVEEVSKPSLKPTPVVEAPKALEVVEPTEVPVLEELDPIEEEDKNPTLDSMFPEPVVEEPVDSELVCDVCGFVSKSDRGLKSHKRWRHAIEGV